MFSKYYFYLPDENQHAVASVFPLAFKYLQKSLPPTVVKSVVSFLGLAVANNGKYVIEIFIIKISFNSFIPSCL
jgi:hypothetical protein